MKQMKTIRLATVALLLLAADLALAASRVATLDAGGSSSAADGRQNPNVVPFPYFIPTNGIDIGLDGCIATPANQANTLNGALSALGQPAGLPLVRRTPNPCDDRFYLMSEPFSCPQFLQQGLNGVNNWSTVPADSTAFQFAPDASGNNILTVTPGSTAVSFANKLCRPASPCADKTNIIIQFDAQFPHLGSSCAPSTAPTTLPAYFYLNASGQVVYALPGGKWQTVEDGPSLAGGAWAHFTLTLDYSTQTWSLWVNGICVVAAAPFLYPTCMYEGFQWTIPPDPSHNCGPTMFRPPIVVNPSPCSYNASLYGTVSYAGSATDDIHVAVDDAPARRSQVSSNLCVYIETNSVWHEVAETKTCGRKFQLSFCTTTDTIYRLRAWCDTAENAFQDTWEPCGAVYGTIWFTNSGTANYSIDVSESLRPQLTTIVNATNGNAYFTPVAPNSSQLCYISHVYDIEMSDPDTNGNGVPDWWEAKYGDLAADPDGDGYSNLEEYQAGTDPTDPTSHPWNISGTVSYFGVATGAIHVVACSTSNGWDAVGSVVLSSPGSFVLTHLPANMTYWVKAWRDVNGSGTNDSWEPRGQMTSPVLLNANVANLTITMVDPDTDQDGLPDMWEMKYGLCSTNAADASADDDGDGYTNLEEYRANTNPKDAYSHPPTVYGSVSYSGMATNAIYIVATPADCTSDDVNARRIYTTVIPKPGSFALTHLPSYGSYLIWAWCGTEGGYFSNTEPWGQYPGVVTLYDSDKYAIQISLSETDSDGDQMFDWWEIEHHLQPFDPNDAGDDPDHDGYTNLEEFRAGTDPQDAADHPWNLGGTILSADGSTGSIYVVACSSSNEWVAVGSTNVPSPRAFTITHLSTNTFYWVKAWRDTSVDGVHQSWEPYGEWTNNPVFLNANVTNVELSLKFPDADADGIPDWWEVVHGLPPSSALGDADGDGYLNIEEYRAGTDPGSAASHPWNVGGWITEADGATGVIHVVACTTSNEWTIAGSTNIPAPGAFVITHLPTNTTYWIKAWRDSTPNGMDDAWEPYGEWTNNPVYLNANFTNLGIALADIDSDRDGLVDGAGGVVTTNHYHDVFPRLRWVPYAANPAYVAGEQDFGTSPTNIDTDCDGLVDGCGGIVTTNRYAALFPGRRWVPYAANPAYVAGELDFGTSATNVDTDGDGLVDGCGGIVITNRYAALFPGRRWVPYAANPGYVAGELDFGTLPTNADTDGDCISDGLEVLAGRNPLARQISLSNPTTFDYDHDGLLDAPDMRMSVRDYPKGCDLDGDGWVDTEAQYGLDSASADTDGDGMGDGAELIHGRDPLMPDEYVRLADFGVVDFSSGILDENWVSVPDGSASVVPSQEGTSLVLQIGSDAANACVYHLIAAVGQPVVWEDYHVLPAKLSAPPVWPSEAKAGVDYYFNEAGQLQVLNSNVWLAVPGATVSNVPVRITVRQDYGSNSPCGKWAIWLDSVLVATNLDMCSGVPEYSIFRCYGGAGGQGSRLYDLAVSNTAPTNIQNKAAPSPALPDVTLTDANPGDGSAVVSWTYEEKPTDADLSLNIQSITIRQSNTATHAVAMLPVSAGARWSTVANLSNGCAYAFTVTIANSATSKVSNTVLATPMAYQATMPEVSSLQGVTANGSRYLSWQFDNGSRADLIGFLVHRVEAGITNLVAALPLGDRRRYAFVDSSAATAQQGTYLVNVIDRQNRRSDGTAIGLAPLAPGSSEEAMGVDRAVFLSGRDVPLHSSGQAWQGVWFGTLNGSNAAMPQGVSMAANGNLVQLVVPARDDAGQFCQAIIAPNDVFALNFQLQIDGWDLANSGVSVCQFQTLTNGPVHEVEVLPGSIRIDGQTFAFRHGGQSHAYTITRDGEDVHLYVDGIEIVRSGTCAARALALGSKPFVRFGARSSAAGLTARWSSFAYLQGVIEYFPRGVLPVAFRQPGDVSGIAVSQNGAAQHVTWTPLADTNVAGYRLTCASPPGWSVDVPFASGCTADISLPFAGDNRVHVQAMDRLGTLGRYGDGVAFTSGQGATGGDVWLKTPGAWTLYSPGNAASWASPLASTQWAFDVSFAVAPTQMVVSGVGQPVMCSVPVGLVRLAGSGSSATVSIGQDWIEVGDSIITNVYAGCCSNRLLLVNDGSSLFVALNGHYLKSLPSLAITNVAAGCLGAAGNSGVYLNGAVLVTNGVWSASISSVATSAAPAAVQELVSPDDGNSSSTSGIVFSWEASEPQAVSCVTVIRTGGISVASAMVPARYWDGTQFVEVNGYRCAPDGDPCRFFMKATPHATFASGKGTARSFLNAYARTGGSRVGAQLNLGGMQDWQVQVATGGVVVTTNVLASPSFFVPGVSVQTGLVPPANTTGDCFRTTDSFNMTSNWSFSAYAILDDFRGTIFRARDANGAITVDCVDLNGQTFIKFGSLATPVDPSRINHFRIEYARDPAGATNRVSLFVNHDTVPLGGNTQSMVSCKTNLCFAEDARLEFGVVSYADANANACPISWSGVVVANNTPSGTAEIATVTNRAPVDAVWKYRTNDVASGQAPDVTTNTRLGFANLVGPNAALVMINRELSLTWTMEFQAAALNGSILTVSVSRSSSRVDVILDAPTMTRYRLVHAPQSNTTLYADGIMQSSDRIRETTGLNNSAPEVAFRVSGNHAEIKDVILVDGAVDDKQAGFAPIHDLRWIPTASPDATGVDNAETSVQLFVDRTLSETNTDAYWFFPYGAGMNIAAVADVEREWSAAYTPLQQSCPVGLSNALTHLVVATGTVIPSAQQSARGAVTTPGNFVALPGDGFIQLWWNQPDAQPVDNYLLTVTDPILGLVVSTNVLPSEIPCTVALQDPRLSGRELNVSIWAQTVDASGAVAGQSAALSGTAVALDRWSVVGTLGSPSISCATGDRRLSLTVGNLPDDTQGFVAWVNQPGAVAATSAVPTRFVTQLGPHAVELMQKVAALATGHTNLTSAQRSSLAALMPMNVLSSSPIKVPAFFYCGDDQSVTMQMSGVQNSAGAGQAYLLTLDPYDDGLPSADGVCHPNLGSRETNANNLGFIPSTNANTFTVRGQPRNQAPVLDGTLSMLTNGVPVAVLQDNPAQSWIHNCLDGNLVAIPGHCGSVSFSGLTAWDRTLVSGSLNLATGNDEVNLQADVRAFDDATLDDAAAVTAPFVYDETTEVVRLAIGGVIDADAIPDGTAEADVTVEDADGAATSDTPLTFVKDAKGPVVSIQGPTGIVSTGFAVQGTYADATGLRSLNVLLSTTNGGYREVECQIDPAYSSAMNGSFFLKPTTAPFEGVNALRVVAVDLLGNVSTSAARNVYYSNASISISNTIALVNGALAFNAWITGVGGGAGVNPAIRSMALNGTNLSTSLLSYAIVNNQHVATLSCSISTNDMPLQPGVNVFVFKVGISFSSDQAEAELVSVAYCYTPEWPELLSVTPAPSSRHTVDGNGLFTFSKSGNPMTVTYVDKYPGVSVPGVSIWANSATGWVNVTTQFNVSDCSATIRSNGVFSISKDHPQIQIVIPAVGIPDSTGNVFTLTYNLSDGQNPVVDAIDPFILGRGLSRTVTLSGFDLGKVGSVSFQSASSGTDAFRIKLEILSRGSMTVTRAYESYTCDTLQVRVVPPVTGICYFAVNDLLATNLPIAVVDADSNDLIDAYLATLQDRNRDGRIDGRDLPTDSRGLPDISKITLPGKVDNPGDGIPGEIKPDPAVPNNGYHPGITDPGAIIGELPGFGYTNSASGSSDEAGLIVVTRPGGVSPMPVYSSIITMSGLCPHDTTRAVVSVAGGREYVAALKRSGIYTNSGFAPLEFMARSVALSAGMNAVSITTERGDRPSACASMQVLVDEAQPTIACDFAAKNAVIPGYHSLYHSLVANEASYEQANYRLAGSISSQSGLDPASIEFRLDNAIIDTSLFKVIPKGTTSSGATNLLTFTLGDGKKIDIWNRWNGTPQNKFLSQETLTWGVHNLRISAKGLNGQTGEKTMVFFFDRGGPVKIPVTLNAAINGSAVCPGCTNKIVDVDWHRSFWSEMGNYYYLLPANAAFDPDDESRTNALYAGAQPYFSKSGSMILQVGSSPVCTNGAIEQFALLADDSAAVSFSVKLPDAQTNQHVHANADSSGMWTYSVTVEPTVSRSPAAQSLGHMLKTPADRFAADAMTVSGTVNLSQTASYTPNPPSSPSTNSITYPGDPGSGGGGSGGGGGGGGGVVDSNPGIGDVVSNTPPRVARTASQVPISVTCPVDAPATVTLSVSAGDYGPDRSPSGSTNLGACAEVSGDVSDISYRHSVTVTPRFPSIYGAAITGSYLTPDASGYYAYDFTFYTNCALYVEGIAVGADRAGLGTNDVHYAFLPVSEARASIAVDERTLVLTTGATTNDPSTLSFNVLVKDPLNSSAEDPSAYPPDVAINNVWLDQTRVHYAHDAANAGTYTACVSRLAVESGLNRIDLTVRNAFGRLTRAAYVVNIGDKDLKRSTTNDLYLISERSLISTMSTNIATFYTTKVCGEFQSAIRSLSVSTSGGTASSIDLKKDVDDGAEQRGYGRFQSPLCFIDSAPLDVDSTTAAPAVAGLPVVAQDPGGTVTLDTGRQTVKVYAEGVSLCESGQAGVRTHRMKLPKPGSASDFELHAYQSSARSAPTAFTLTFLSASGNPIDMGDGSNTLTIAVDVDKTGDIFDKRGKQYDAVKMLTLVRAIDDNSGRRYAEEDNRLKVLLHCDDYVLVTAGDLSTYAVVVPSVDTLGYEAVTGVTPSTSRTVPTPVMDVNAAVLLHNHELKISHVNQAVEGVGLPGVLAQTYRSGRGGASSLGEGWTGSWEAYFFKDGDRYVYHAADGREDVFGASGDGASLEVPPGYDCKAEVSGADKRIVLTWTDGTTETYDAAPDRQLLKIQKTADRFGNRVRYRYDENDCVYEMDDDMNRTCRFSYKELGLEGLRLRKIEDFGNLTYLYDYDDQAHLTAIRCETTPLCVTNPAIQSYEVDYAWDTSLSPACINRIQPGGSTYAAISYGTAPQVSGVMWGGGTTVGEAFAGSTHTDTRGVATTYAFGSGDTSWKCSTRTCGATTSFGYDDEQHLRTLTYPMGKQTVWTYHACASSTDKRGAANVWSVQTTAGGASVGRTFTYDAAPYYQLKSASDSSGAQTTYDYEGAQATLSKVSVKNQSGGFDATTFRCNSHGQVERVRDPSGSLTVNEFYAAGDRITNAGNTLGDLPGALYKVIQTADGEHSLDADSAAIADSNRFETVIGRDAYGRAISTTVPNKGTKSCATYNRLGQLVETFDVPMTGYNPAVGSLETRNIVTYTYWPNGLVASTTWKNPVESAGNIALPNYTWVSRVTTCIYDDVGRVISVVSPVDGDGGTTTCTYKNGGSLDLLDNVHEVNGAYTVYGYDTRGRVASVVRNAADAAGTLAAPAVKAVNTYNDDDAVTRVNTFYGASDERDVTYDVDGLDRVKTISDLSTGAREETDWNSTSGLVDAERAFAGVKVSGTTRAYYGNGALHTVTDAMRNNAPVSLTADAATRTCTLTGPDNNVRSSVRNGVGQTVANEIASASGGALTTFNGQSIGWTKGGSIQRVLRGVTAATSGGSATVVPCNAYDIADRRTGQTFPALNGSSTMRPSAFGPPAACQDAAGIKSTAGLDEAGEPVKAVEAAGGTARVSESKSSRPGRWTAFRRGSLGIRQDLDAAGQMTGKAYFYNAASLDLSGAPSASQNFTYDGMGRLASETREDGTVLCYVYYGTGDANSNNVDQLHEIRLGSASGPLLRSFADYDCFGNPTTLKEFGAPGDETAYVMTTRAYYGADGNAHINFGQLSRETTRIYANGALVPCSTYAVGYAYDLAGKCTAMVLPDNATQVGYGYRNDTVLDAVTLGPVGETGTAVYQATPDPVYLVPVSKTLGGAGVQVTLNVAYTDPNLGLWQTLTMSGGSGVVCSNAYDARGLKDGFTEWNGSSVRGFGYDDLARWHAASGGKFGAEGVTLDAQDVRIAATVAGQAVTYAAGTAPGQLASFTCGTGLLASNGAPPRAGVPDNGGTFSLTYDGRGSLTHDDRYVFAWDAFNRITNVVDTTWTSGDSVPQSVSYQYDALGRRVARTYSAQTGGWTNEQAVYDGYAVIEEHARDTGGLLRRYLYEGTAVNRPCLVQQDFDGDGIVDSANDEAYRLVTDDRGSVLAVVNKAGQIVEKVHYNSTGLALSFAADDTTATTNADGFVSCRPSAVRFGFCGMYCEPFTGKYHTHHRDYDPLHAWWISRDPISEQGGINLYGFANGDTINGADPLGLAVDRDVPSGRFDVVNGVPMMLLEDREWSIWNIRGANDYKVIGSKWTPATGGNLDYFEQDANGSWLKKGAAARDAINKAQQFNDTQHASTQLQAIQGVQATLVLAAPAAEAGAVAYATEVAWNELGLPSPKNALSMLRGSWAMARTGARYLNPGNWTFATGRLFSGVPVPKFVGNGNSSLTPAVRALSEANINKSGITVLGPYNPPPGYVSYLSKAEARGASYFDLGNTWNSLTQAEREAANFHFLDVIASRSDKVVLSVPKAEIIPGSATSKEVEYLVEKLKYKWVNQWSLQPR